MQKNKYFLLGLAILAGLNLLAWSAVFQINRNYLEVYFFDIGQGDASFIETPSGYQVLIDGGPSSAVLEKLGRVMPFWDRSIDLIILSHPEKDHITGLIEVLKRYEVKSVLWTGIVRDTAEYQEWQEGIEKEGAKIIIAQAGEKIVLGKAEIDILYPAENLENQQVKDTNDSSIVAKLIYGGKSFLFTGDISEKIEAILAENILEIDSDVLKVAHHGSKYSTIDNFLVAVSPQAAVIEVGKNSYGHPTQEVLDRLLKYGINILRTDQNGDIKFISDGNNLIIKNN